jgi:hypothetical protein
MVDDGLFQIHAPGFKNLNPRFTIYRVEDPSAQNGFWNDLLGTGLEPTMLPMASTCFNALKLPPYQSIETLRAKLLAAINLAGGFGMG